MDYNLFFFKGDFDCAPTIVPIYQFMEDRKIGTTVGVAYHSINRKMMKIRLDSIIPVQALEFDSSEVKLALLSWNHLHPELHLESKINTASRDCCFCIKATEKVCSNNEKEKEQLQNT